MVVATIVKLTEPEQPTVSERPIKKVAKNVVTESSYWKMFTPSLTLTSLPNFDDSIYLAKHDMVSKSLRAISPRQSL